MKSNHRKIAIIGVGHVGSHCALNIAMEGIAEEIVFIDKDIEKANSHAKDIKDAVMYMKHPISIEVGDYSDISDADILVISIGTSRKKGQTRLDMLDDAIVEMKTVTEAIKSSNFNGIIITISNPADVIANYTYVHTGLPAHKIFGTGTSLDTARLKRTISETLGIDIRSIQCYSMGEHGNSSMIPFSNITIGGKPFIDFINDNPKYKDISLDMILERTREIGNEIIDGKGSTEFGIGAVLADICKAVLYDEKRIMPVSTYMQGEYGQSGFYIGVPAIIGSEGVESIVEINLSQEEQRQFYDSCEIIKKYNLRAESI